MKPVNSRLLPERHQVTFAVYSVASFVYRWMVMILIFWFITSIFEPYGLASVGYVLVAISLFGMVVVPLFKLAKFFWAPGRIREVKRFNFVCTAVASVVVVGLISYLPISHYVYGVTTIRPRDAQMVVVTQPGSLQSIHVQAGQRVEAGDVIAVLVNRQLELELLSLEGELERLKSDLLGFELNRSVYLDSERLIGEANVEIKNLESRIAVKKKQLDPLVLRADRSGVVILPPNLPQKPSVKSELKAWSGTPIDPANLNAFLDRNTLVCMVADSDQFEAIVVIDQSDVQLVESNQPVRLLLEPSRGQVVTGKVVNVSQDELSAVPRELSQTNGGPIAVKPTAEGTEVPVLKQYEVYAALNAEAVKSTGVSLASGFYGDAKIYVGQSSLGAMTVRYFRNLVNFR